MPRRAWLAGLLIGLAVLTALVAWQGWRPLVEALGEAGWKALWLPLYFAAPMALAACSWRLLFLRDRQPGFGLAFYGTWVGLAVNWLLPVATVGGEYVRVRLLARRGRPLPEAAAGVVADKTLQMASQLGFALIGLALFFQRGMEAGLVLTALAGLALFGLLLVIVYRIQRAGPFGRSAAWLERLTGSARLADAREQALEADRELLAVYRRRRRLAAAFGLRMLFRLVWAGEIWLALNFLGHPVSLAEAVLLESLIQVIRGASFMIPGGLGAQEAGAVFLSLALGIPAETGLALALLKRVREIVVGLPGLIAWQVEEGRSLLAQ